MLTRYVLSKLGGVAAAWQVAAVPAGGIFAICQGAAMGGAALGVIHAIGAALIAAGFGFGMAGAACTAKEACC